MHITYAANIWSSHHLSLLPNTDSDTPSIPITLLLRAAHPLHSTRELTLLIKLSLQETPDRNPILGQHPHHPNIIFGLGFSGMGIGLPQVAF